MGGGWIAPEERGRNASELETAQRREVGARGHPAVGFLKGLDLKGMKCPYALHQHPGPKHLSDRSAWAGPHGRGGSPVQSLLVFTWGLRGSQELLRGEGGAHSEDTFGWLPRQMGCAILSPPPPPPT